MNGVGRALLAAVVALSASSCVRYMRYQYDEPLPPAALEALATGQSLTECLQRLGAPARVYEYRGSGAALLWAWRDADAWEIDLSLPLQDQVSASFDLDLAAVEGSGCMLWFDADLRLERWRSGPVGELLVARVRPGAVDDGG